MRGWFAGRIAPLILTSEHDPVAHCTPVDGIRVVTACLGNAPRGAAPVVVLVFAFEQKHPRLNTAGCKFSTRCVMPQPNAVAFDFQRHLRAIMIQENNVFAAKAWCKVIR